MSNPKNIRKGGYQPSKAAPASPPKPPANWKPSPGALSPFTGKPLTP